MMICTYYTPPSKFQLPTISLVIKDGKLLTLDWHSQKTQSILSRCNEQPTLILSDKLDDNKPNQRLAKQVIGELDEYFAGVRQEFSIPLDLSHGTAFQQMVWQALLTIPYGQTISYAELARRIHRPTAFRACANANGKNPISLIIPCHRVIASDGGLGGYTGGIGIKQTLLNLEVGKACQSSTIIVG